MAAGPGWEVREDTVNYFASAECSAYAMTGLDSNWIELLFLSFTGTPPAGVTKATFDRFTLRAIQCGFYNLFATAEGAAAIDAAFPLPACADENVLQVIEYQQAHGFQGPDPGMNALAWVMTRSPAYYNRVMALAACASAPSSAAEQSVRTLADADCAAWANVPKLEEGVFTLLFKTFYGVPPDGVSQETFDRFNLRAIQCDLYSKKGDANVGNMLRQMMPGCAEPAVRDELLAYIRQYGYQGPDAAMNGAAWAATRVDGYLWDFEHLPVCGSSSSPTLPTPSPAPAPYTPPPSSSSPAPYTPPYTPPSTTPAPYTPPSYQQPDTTPTTVPSYDQPAPYVPPTYSSPPPSSGGGGGGQPDTTPVLVDGGAPLPSLPGGAQPSPSPAKRAGMLLPGLMILLVVGGGTAYYLSSRKKAA